MGTGEVVALAAALSLSITKAIDTVRNAVDPTGVMVPKVVWNVLAIVLAVGGCLIWSVNAFEALGASGELQSTAGEVLTGFTLMGGAGLFHELMDLFSSKAKEAYPPSVELLEEEVVEEVARRPKNPGR